MAWFSPENVVQRGGGIFTLTFTSASSDDFDGIAFAEEYLSQITLFCPIDSFLPSSLFNHAFVIRGLISLLASLQSILLEGLWRPRTTLLVLSQHFHLFFLTLP